MPDDGLIHRFAGVLVPHQSGFALIGNADGDDLLRFNLLIGQHLSATVQHALPDILWVMFDPAIVRIMLSMTVMILMILLLVILVMIAMIVMIGMIEMTGMILFSCMLS